MSGNFDIRCIRYRDKNGDISMNNIENWKNVKNRYVFTSDW